MNIWLPKNGELLWSSLLYTNHAMSYKWFTFFQCNSMHLCKY